MQGRSVDISSAMATHTIQVRNPDMQQRATIDYSLATKIHEAYLLYRAQKRPCAKTVMQIGVHVLPQKIASLVRVLPLLKWPHMRAWYLR